MKSPSAAVPLPPINASAAVRLVSEMMAVPGRSGQERKIHTAVRARLKSLGVSSSAIVEDTAQKRSPIGQRREGFSREKTGVFVRSSM
jgi:hypothetical protein